MNSENSKTSKPHVSKLKLNNQLDLRIGEKIIALPNLSIYYTQKNIKSSYSVSNIQDYFKYILKKHGEIIDKPSVQIYVNKTENRITLNIKNGHSLELLLPGTMKLLGNTGNEIIKDKNGENLPHLEVTEVVLVHCNIVNNDY